jgi:hypothetical protein
VSTKQLAVCRDTRYVADVEDNTGQAIAEKNIRTHLNAPTVGWLGMENIGDMVLQIEDAQYSWIELTESTSCAVITCTSIFARQSQKLGRLLGLVT